MVIKHKKLHDLTEWPENLPIPEGWQKYESSSAPACSTAGDEIIETVFRYIDRMNDIVTGDPADLILEEFTAELDPIIARYIADASR